MFTALVNILLGASFDRLRGGGLDHKWKHFNHVGSLLMGFLIGILLTNHFIWSFIIAFFWFLGEKPGWGDAVGKMLYGHEQWKTLYDNTDHKKDSVYLNNGWWTGVMRGLLWGGALLLGLIFGRLALQLPYLSVLELHVASALCSVGILPWHPPWLDQNSLLNNWPWLKTCLVGCIMLLYLGILFPLTAFLARVISARKPQFDPWPLMEWLRGGAVVAATYASLAQSAAIYEFWPRFWHQITCYL